MVVLGYVLAVVAGVSLGLIGSGGSILTVPILVYLMGVPPTLATAYSLFVVGTSALFGCSSYWRKGLVSLSTAVNFAIPAFVAVYATRRWLLPAMPEVLFAIGDWSFSKEMGIMVLFALLMGVSAISMLRKKFPSEGTAEAEAAAPPEQNTTNYALIALEGAVVGCLTGMVGAGGGFLIIPALVLLVRLPMKVAVGTSLLIIAVKSLIGFVGDVQAGQAIDWSLLLPFTGMMVGGILLGGRLSNAVSGQQLKKGFGYFVLVMAAYILIRELFFG